METRDFLQQSGYRGHYNFAGCSTPDGLAALPLLNDMIDYLESAQVGCNTLELGHVLIKRSLMERFLNGDESYVSTLAHSPAEASRMYVAAGSFFLDRLSRKAAVLAMEGKDNVEVINGVIGEWLTSNGKEAGGKLLYLLKENIDLQKQEKETDGFWEKPPKVTFLTPDEVQYYRKIYSIKDDLNGNRLFALLNLFITKYGNGKKYVSEIVIAALDWCRLAQTEQGNGAEQLFGVYMRSAAQSSTLMWQAVAGAGVELSLASGIPFLEVVDTVDTLVSRFHLNLSDLLASANGLDKPDYVKWINEFQVR
ncbi:hypothetical protein KKB64_02255 [Patescibacteria group bacterium]|nr:hypothetical protein [Patescibacteria group bacterium]MBU2459843.1 hypothetical protein [Patescibacteria group bacterium]